MKIIGGPFSEIPMMKDENGKICNLPDIRYIGSGRAALYIILIHIRKLSFSNTVWLPAYYCDVAREVARSLGFMVKYYSVTYSLDHYSADTSKIRFGDIVVFLNYYGFSEKILQKQMKTLKTKGCILIEDITHSLLSNNISDFSDYYYGSLRKWSGFVTGGVLSGANLSIESNYDADDELVHHMDSFIEEYRAYMRTGMGDREYFSNCFYEAELIINQNYKKDGVHENDLIAMKHWDIDKVISKRIQNARYLLKYIKNKNVFIFDKISPGDVPFFFPVYLKNRKEVCALKSEAKRS